MANLIPILDVAKKLKISRQTIYNYLKRDEEFNNCSYKLFNKIYFDEEKLNNYIQKKFN